MTHIIKIQALVYTWRGDKYAEVRHEASANTQEKIEVDLESDMGFMIAALQHAAQRMTEMEEMLKAIPSNIKFELVQQEDSVLPAIEPAYFTLAE